jgi:hypothetical protein
MRREISQILYFQQVISCGNHATGVTSMSHEFASKVMEKSI